MSGQIKYPRRILIEVKDVKEDAYIHRGVSSIEPAFGFETKIIGRLYERDEDGGLVDKKEAEIRLWECTDVEFEPEKHLDSESRPIVGWVDQESDYTIGLRFRVPIAFSRGLLECVYRSLSIPDASRSIGVTIYFNESYRYHGRTGEYITGIHYEHPSQAKEPYSL